MRSPDGRIAAIERVRVRGRRRRDAGGAIGARVPGEQARGK